MKKNGFTLIEILVTAGIIAVLSVIGVVSYTSINMRSRDAKRKSDLEQMRSALEMYRTDTGSYPGSGTGFTLMSASLSDLVSLNYIPSIPSDPKSTSNPPLNYYYSPLPLGTTAPYYSYCICAKLESDVVGSNTCGVTLATDAGGNSACNYGLKNP